MKWLDRRWVGRTDRAIIGLVSAVVDNVPLVAASMGMYDLQQYPADSFIWNSWPTAPARAAPSSSSARRPGVAAMGLEKIDFWYMRKISSLA